MGIFLVLKLIPTKSCDETMCNNANHVYRDRLRREWMNVLEIQIDEYINRTAILAASASAKIIYPFYTIVYVLLLQYLNI